MNSMTPPTSKDATNRYEWKELDVVPNVEEATKDNRSSLPFLQSFDDIVSDINIPAFLHNHKATLRFPETVCIDTRRTCRAIRLHILTCVVLCCFLPSAVVVTYSGRTRRRAKRYETSNR
jgi:hypothetical protein